MIRLALFISGGGTTAGRIIKYFREKSVSVKPVLVIASKSGIEGIERVKNSGFQNKGIFIVNPKDYKNVDNFADVLISLCRKYKIDFIGQYGWLPLTPGKLIKEYQGKIINQHPGPLDENGVDFGGKGMYGKRVHAAVLYFRRKTGHDYWTEATSHLVTVNYDEGAAIGRVRIPILENDTVESLALKVLPVEHDLQISVLNILASGKFKLLKRDRPLIRKSEYPVLKKAKEIAAVLYPKG